jgi:ribose-phosphate pyrophosphokinase
VKDEIKLFSGTSNPALARAIADGVGVPLGAAEVGRFSDGEVQVEITENVRGGDVFVIQSTCTPTNDNVMELLLMLDAFKRASAKRLTAVVPYYGYARQDRKVAPRVPISAKLIADLITTAGAMRVLTVDLHAGQIQGFFDVPVDEMSAMYLTAQYFVERRLEHPVVVSPDLGNTKRARNFADILGCPLAIIEKRRIGNEDKSEALNLIGSVAGKQVVIVDDEIDTAGSITQAADVCLRNGASEVYATCIHPVFSGPAVERLKASPIREVVVTNTIAVSPEKVFDKLVILSVAELLAEAIQRIHAGASVSTAYRSAEAFQARLSFVTPEG